MEFKLRDRKFGVEIEFFGTTHENLELELRARGLSVYFEGYSHITTDWWKIVTDSSVTNTGTGERHGLELVSPILSGEEGMRELKLACDALRAAGAKVDKTCGLHIHHDASGIDIEGLRRLATYYIRWQPVIDHMVSPSRRNQSYYCRHMQTFYDSNLNGDTAFEKSQSAKEIYTSISSFPDRYHVLNIREAYGRHGTVEFRQHQGTIEYWKIESWLILTQNIVDRAAAHQLRITNGKTSLKRFRDGLGTTGSNATDEYGTRSSRNMVRRIQQLNPGDGLYTEYA